MIRRRPWLRRTSLIAVTTTDRSHALRGNAARDALRHIQQRNAERPQRSFPRGERSLAGVSSCEACASTPPQPGSTRRTESVHQR
ncbi:hypothetical protein C1X35_02145 [Pseudomonas sp. FW306-1C-G01A]|nr:hypothetical protein C1X56_00925 [Pseudomonas sp. GW101-1A09]PMV96550.1 hypothetical protein C1X51_07070 [Pseudomonas sp. FW306-2-2C-B10A]PMV99291.1 hypothetical protein C1X55_13160 [Pseudomonas sp. GW460-C8]PMW07078.1 hypothetical protein C1X50_05210 [Pseudomonas sp. MPR-TSA4]PMW19406.1 hypothetical protein C1X52_06945 [Pseudomonas sp. FW306-2-1A-C05A]PMW23774.1 hypothetical protein C1X40_05505 [Pseudomonas sp. GW456-11-11-14-TSB2]PMW25027.1 hypothetical protein C1X53_07595 [Pseudomonas s